MTRRTDERERIRELIARHDSPGPRYTSYPTSVEFDEAVDADVYAARLAGANARADEPLSLYLHLPFCAERCLFCGCHVVISPTHSRSLPYLELLHREIELVASHLPDRRGFAQLHLGGGTPTYQSPEELDALLARLYAHFEPVDGAELAVEVDPRVTTEAHVDALARRGFNRISLGVQDFTPEVQQAIHRVQSFEQTRDVIEAARSRGYRGVNVDLIYGLPLQTARTFEQTVERALELEPDRSAVYSFAHVPWIRGHQRMLEENALPSAELKAELFAIARERFLAAGYVAIGMDHFAKPDDELARARAAGTLRRNFQGYAVIPAPDVIGLGTSAIGDVDGAYVQNEKKLSTYGRAVQAGRLPTLRGVARSADDDVRRDVIHALMCNFVVDVPAIEAAHGVDFAAVFAEDLERLRACERDGLVTLAPERIEATPEGELFVRNLARCFDRYWREKHEQASAQVFSRTV